jgi:hypothetical protein
MDGIGVLALTGVRPIPNTAQLHTLVPNSSNVKEILLGTIASLKLSGEKWENFSFH